MRRYCWSDTTVGKEDNRNGLKVLVKGKWVLAGDFWAVTCEAGRSVVCLFVCLLDYLHVCLGCGTCIPSFHLRCIVGIAHDVNIHSLASERTQRP